MPYLMAGSMIAGGVLGGFSGSSEARNKYNAEMAAYNDRTIRETIAHSKQQNKFKICLMQRQCLETMPENV